MRVEGSPVYRYFPELALKVYKDVDIVWDASTLGIWNVLAYFPDRGYGFRCNSVDQDAKINFITGYMDFIRDPDDVIEYMMEHVSEEHFEDFEKTFSQWLENKAVRDMLAEGDYEE